MAIVSITGSQILCQYIEPTQNANGSPVTDLTKTRIYYQIQGREVVLAKEIPASALTGGGTVSEQIVVPVNENEEVFVDIWFTAVDDVDNESARSDVYVKQIDLLAPAPPQ